MGAAHSKACLTCRKDYYLGYGPYSSLLERENRFPFDEHVDHELAGYNEDCTHMEGDDLMMENQFGSDLYIKGLALFEKVDLSGEK